MQKTKKEMFQINGPMSILGGGGWIEDDIVSFFFTMEKKNHSLDE